jgi:hypothetical protein
MAHLSSLAFVVLMLFCLVPKAQAAPARLFDNPFRESPVRGAPDDLLLLSGSGLSNSDVVVYVRLTNTTQTPVRPASIPSSSTSTQGVAQVASSANVPHSLAIRLPGNLSSGRAYALWVVNAAGEWSNPVRINDARPLWISPDFTYRTATIGALPRALKVVGRNLLRGPLAVTRVRIVGPTTYTLTAQDDGDPESSVERYVARVSLPSSMLVGSYSVQVSRDGTNWVPLQGQQFTVRADPSVSPSYAISNYGCSPNDGADDTACLLAAIAAATSTAGTVMLGDGVWDLVNSATPGVDPVNGIVVPIGVSLRGADSGGSQLVKSASWSAPIGLSVLGKNTIRGIQFEDRGPPAGRSGVGRIPGYLQLGSSIGSSVVEDVVITECVFRWDLFAIVAALRPIKRLFIIENVLGGHAGGLYFGGDPSAIHESHIDDSVIANNTFLPGGHPTPIASQLGMSYRVDLSGNNADGQDSRLIVPTGPHGWRGAFFFHMSGNHEMLLISQNRMTCTGDRADSGQGEAIVFDTQANVTGFEQAQTVQAATTSTVTVAGPMKRLETGFFGEHWIQIGGGTGIGQVRKIVSYTAPAASQVTFTVSPAWDVVPQANNSLLTVAREFWQTYTVDNVVDNQSCLTKKLGSIGILAMAADSILEGNKQLGTDGILLLSLYNTVFVDQNNDHSPDDGVDRMQLFQSFVDVQANYGSSCNSNAITVAYGARVSPDGGTPSILTGAYGIGIAHNRIAKADRTAAVALVHGWNAQAASKLLQSPLVHHNTISGLPLEPEDEPCPDDPAAGVGIRLEPSVWNGVLYGNSFEDVSLPVDDQGTGTVQLP